MVEDHNALARYDGRAAATRQDRLPARGGSAAPIHEPGELHWSDSAFTREQCWERLSPAVRDRVNQRIGGLLEWWASDQDERVTAVVLGTRALVALEPTVNADGKAATRLNVVHIDESSFRSVRLNEVVGARPPAGQSANPQADPRRPGWLGGNPRSGSVPGGQPGAAPSPAAPLARTLDGGMSSFLGMLPPRAQQLLQDPFLHAPQQLQYEYFYYRAGTGRGLGGATLHVWCYLTDHRTVTFCAGRGHGYREGSGVSSWELTCWRASTTPRPRDGNR